MKKTLFLLPLFVIGVIAKGQKKLPLTLESIWSGYFDEKKLQPHILHTKPAVAFIRAERETNFEGILTLDMVTGLIIDTIFTNQTKVEDNGTPTTFAFFEDFELSPDDSKILIKTERQSIYHQSYKEFVYIWDDNKKTLKPVSTDGKISCASFNPQGTLLAYVRDANIYIRNLETDKTTAVTTDGSYGSIINGMADEVYEDGFGLHKMYEWSPSGDKIAFAKTNQGFVKKIPLSTYEKNEPVIKQMVFAKPGEAISEVGVFVYDIKNNAFSKLEFGSNSNQYITNFKWQQNSSSLLVERLDRKQKRLDIVQNNANNGSLIKIVYTEEKPDYIKINSNNIIMHPTKNTFFWLSESSGYNHIYEIDYTNNKVSAITNGKWDVESFEGYDAQKGKIFFITNMQNEHQQELYAINDNGNNLEKITKGGGWHNVWLSKDFNYFFDKATTINSPSVYKIFKTNGKEITNKAIVENKRFQDNIKPYDLNDAKYFTFKNKNDDFINGWVINGDNDSLKKSKKKPLLLYVYGGNNKQEVTDQWDDRMAMTYRYFANKGYTVACIDPSGTPGRGEKFRKLTYNNLTNVVIDDIIGAKNYLQNKYNIDVNKTALMGWSYGGYLASLFATKYSNEFTNTIAIAPITNWRNYGAAYTERIIGSPSDNPELYKSLMPEEYIQTYNGGLLIIHGSADDNVHLQHTLKLAKALTESDSYYDIQIFTDKGHNLSDGGIDKTRMNLYRKIYKFLERNKVAP